MDRRSSWHLSVYVCIYPAKPTEAKCITHLTLTKGKICWEDGIISWYVSNSIASKHTKKSLITTWPNHMGQPALIVLDFNITSFTN